MFKLGTNRKSLWTLAPDIGFLGTIRLGKYYPRKYLKVKILDLEFDKYLLDR